MLRRWVGSRGPVRKAVQRGCGHCPSTGCHRGGGARPQRTRHPPGWRVARRGRSCRLPQSFLWAWRIWCRQVPAPWHVSFRWRLDEGPDSAIAVEGPTRRDINFAEKPYLSGQDDFGKGIAAEIPHPLLELHQRRLLAPALLQLGDKVTPKLLQECDRQLLLRFPGLLFESLLARGSPGGTMGDEPLTACRRRRRPSPGHPQNGSQSQAVGPRHRDNKRR